MDDLKARMQSYLSQQRESLFAKCDGLSERDLRLPRTPTGTSLIGIVKHCLNVEYGYFGPTFGRELDDTSELVGPDMWDIDPQADWYATAEETTDGILALYRRVIAFCDETVAERDLDAPGTVAWWGPKEVTLGWILTHVTQELARHAGQADIVRESIDGAVGYWSPGDNLPDGYDWAAYTAKLTEIAERF